MLNAVHNSSFTIICSLLLTLCLSWVGCSLKIKSPGSIGTNIFSIVSLPSSLTFWISLLCEHWRRFPLSAQRISYIRNWNTVVILVQFNWWEVNCHYCSDLNWVLTGLVWSPVQTDSQSASAGSAPGSPVLHWVIIWTGRINPDLTNCSRRFLSSDVQ